MTPQKQTVFGNVEGNCLSACVASILDLPIETVPVFVRDGDAWFSSLCNWLKERGIGVVYIDGKSGVGSYNCCYIATGPSPRGKWLHAVVGKNGEDHFFDPHPSDEFLAGSVEYRMFLIPGSAQ